MVSWVGNADSLNLLLQWLQVEVKLVLDVHRLDEYGCESYFSLLSNICGKLKRTKRVHLGEGKKINYAATPALKAGVQPCQRQGQRRMPY